MKLTDEMLQSGANHIRPYGEPLAFTPVGLQTSAEGNTALFRVRFATETLTWAVRVDPQGKINGFDLRRNARNHVYRIVTRLIEGYEGCASLRTFGSVEHAPLERCAESVRMIEIIVWIVCHAEALHHAL